MLSELQPFLVQVQPFLESVLNDAGLWLTAVDAAERLKQLRKLPQHAEEKLPNYNVLQVSVRRAYLSAIRDVLQEHSSQYPKYAQDFEDAVVVLKEDIANLDTANDTNAILQGTWMLSYDGIHQLLPLAQGNTKVFAEDLGKAVRTELDKRFGEGGFGEMLKKLTHQETNALVKKTREYFLKEYQTNDCLQAVFTGALFVQLISRDEAEQRQLPEEVVQHLDTLWSQLRNQISTENQQSAELLKQHIDQRLSVITKHIDQAKREIIDEVGDAKREIIGEFQKSQTQAEHGAPYEPRRLVGDVMTLPGFVGRHEERAELHKSVVMRENRFIQVCGQSGLGKTALVTQFINEDEDSYFNSIVVVSLRENKLATFEKIIDYLLQTLPPTKQKKLQSLKSLNADRQQDMDTPKKQDVSQQISTILRTCIAEHKTLIVLDNLEDALEDNFFRKEYAPLKAFVADVVQLDQHACQLLVTSQQTLNMASLGRGLGGSTKTQRIGLDKGLSLADRCEMLREYGKSSGILQTEPEALLRAVAEKLGGIPLALVNFVISLLDDPTLTLEACLHNPDFLEGLRDEPAKVLYENLSEDAQTVFKGLAVFGKRVPAKAIRKLYPELDTETILKRLATDFVQFDKTHSLQITYALHPSNQEYAYKQLAEDERQDLHKKAAAFYRNERTPQKTWQTLKDVQPQLDEFEQLVRAEVYDEACRVLTSIDDYLMLWGQVALTRDLHLQLRDYIVDKTHVVNKTLQCLHFNSLGSAYRDLGKVRQAIKYYKQGLTLAYETGDLRSQSAILGNWGIAYGKVGKIYLSIKYFKKALAISCVINDSFGEGTHFGNLGVAYRDLGKLHCAIEYFEKALAISRVTNNRRGEGNHLGNLGSAYCDLGEVNRAIRYYNQALTIVREIGDRGGEGVKLGNLGVAYYDLGKVRQAIKHYNQALTIAREVGDSRSEGASLSNLGLAYKSLGETDHAVEYYNQALMIAREVGDRRSEGNCLGRFGSLYSDSGEVSRAVKYYNQALMIAREVGDRRSEGVSLSNLGSAYSNLDKVRHAIEYHEQALIIARKIGDRRGEGAYLGNLGNAYSKLGEVRRAIEYYKQALIIVREISDCRGEGIALSNLGNAYSKLGEVRRAIEYYEQALIIVCKISDRRGEGISLSSLGNAYNDLGEVRCAIEYHEQALIIAREIGDRHNESASLGNLGIAYRNLGEVRRAIEYYDQALTITCEIGDRHNESASLGNLGIAYSHLGKVRRAIEYCNQALTIAREIGDRNGENSWLGSLGNAYSDLGEVRRAIEYYGQALTIAREIGDHRKEGIHLGNLGRAYHHLGEVYRAIEYYDQALTIAREIGNRRSESASLGNLGVAYGVLGEVRRAIEYYNQALTIARETGDRHSEGSWLGILGNAYGVLGHRHRHKTLVCQIVSLVILKETESTQIKEVNEWLLAQWRKYPLSSNPLKIIFQFLFKKFRILILNTLLRALFPDGDTILNEATGQNYTFFRDAPADMPERILAIIDQYAQDTE